MVAKVFLASIHLFHRGKDISTDRPLPLMHFRKIFQPSPYRLGGGNGESFEKEVVKRAATDRSMQKWGVSLKEYASCIAIATFKLPCIIKESWSGLRIAQRAMLPRARTPLLIPTGISRLCHAGVGYASHPRGYNLLPQQPFHWRGPGWCMAAEALTEHSRDKWGSTVTIL